MDVVPEKAFIELPGAKRLLIIPAAGREGVITVLGYKNDGVYYGSDALQFDQYSGKLLHRRNDSEKNKGEKLIEMNYDIHIINILNVINIYFISNNFLRYSALYYTAFIQLYLIRYL